MTYIDSSIHRVRSYRIAQGLSINGLAAKAGLSESTIRRMDSPDWNPTRETLQALERVVPAEFGKGAPASEAA